MKKVAVLCGVLAWAVWFRKPTPEPSGQVTVQMACSTEAGLWCYDEGGAARERCQSDYWRRCTKGRDPNQIAAGHDPAEAQRAMRYLQKGWQR